MKLEAISLKGILGFREAVSIDLRDVPAGLIAVTGENGSGKTTLMETAPATVFREFPSRADRPLVDYAHGADSHVSIVFEIEGRGVFVARVNLDATKRASDAVILHMGADGTPTILNDGKVSTFDAWCRANLPAKALVLASSFSAQNRAGSFATLDRKGRKDLFAQLLGLDHYESMATTARTAAKLAAAARDRLGVHQEALARDTKPGDRQTLAQVLELKERTLANDRELRAVLEAQATELDRALAEALRAVHDAEDADRRRQEAAIRLAEAERAVGALAAERTASATMLRADLDRIEAMVARDRSRIEARRQSAMTGLEQALRALERTCDGEVAEIAATYQKATADRETRLRNNHELLANAAQIRRDAERLNRLEEGETAVMEAERVARESLATATAEAQRIRDAVSHARRHAADLERARSDAALLTTVPCGGQGEFATCQFLTRAAAAQGAIPEIAVHADRLPALVAEGEAADAAVLRASELVRQAEHARQQHAVAIAQLRPALVALPRLEAATLRVAELRLEIADLGTRQTDETAAAARRKADQQRRLHEVHDRTIAEADAELHQAEATADADREHAQAAHHARLAETDRKGVELSARLAAAERALAALEVTGQRLENARRELAGVTAKQETHRQTWETCIAQIAHGEARVTALQRDLAAFDERAARLASLEDAIQRIADEMLDWALIDRVMSRDGLPNLEIDAAGPTVSSYANDLMTACFSGRFTLDLVTQEAKAGGKGVKETFEVKVLDNERGGVARDLTDLSGGEQIIVDECLKSALAILVNTRSPMPIRTCWRDETTGPLDPENAARYLAMLRRLRELSGAYHILFVTHSLDAASSADAQIRVSNGSARLVLPPFTEAA